MRWWRSMSDLCAVQIDLKGCLVRDLASFYESCELSMVLEIHPALSFFPYWSVLPLLSHFSPQSLAFSIDFVIALIGTHLPMLCTFTLQGFLVLKTVQVRSKFWEKALSVNAFTTYGFSFILENSFCTCLFTLTVFLAHIVAFLCQVWQKEDFDTDLHPLWQRWLTLIYQ